MSDEYSEYYESDDGAGEPGHRERAAAGRARRWGRRDWRLLHRIFRYLSVTELATAAAVCRKWNVSIDNDTRWSSLCQEMGIYKRPFKDLPWRRVYIRALATAKNFNSRTSSYTSCLLRKGHKDAVWALALGKTKVYSGGSDRVAKMWDVNALNCRETLKSFEGGVWALDYDPVSGLVAAGDTEGFVHVFDGETGETKSSFQAHTTTVSALQLDGGSLITGSFDNSVVVHDLETQVQTHVLQGARAGGHKFHVWCLQAAHGRVVSGGWDCKLKVWDLKSATCTANLVGHSGPVRAVAFDGARVVSGSWDKSLKMWDLAYPASPLHTLTGHSGPVSSLAVDESKIVSGSYDGTVRIWALAGAPPPCIRTLKANTGGVLAVALDWRRVYAAGKDKKIRVFDFAAE
ncbi:F-box/WD repeat-containing protein 7 [Thecamonas trahens ATCC 50062]|uniref:F-box/WD repeat-containing protein 7 n=1 Tax=Thecamonas trahens ATCC 50062 TaxID=461836 RepID=A0A0L0DGM8_THETB|nr:F-box/WD repeat-containing protein 7 [Thecamonas trahens ATCC 50062]KNC51345.1 F-box/WD repeat-containing protein 7 [Thecamonas trahens ATCC 50062]|eukprot:XP_013756265.1 F-box/WD repeat-containing protein 7 [Thecamonas trahens ATCC 50062]